MVLKLVTKRKKPAFKQKLASFKLKERGVIDLFETLLPEGKEEFNFGKLSDTLETLEHENISSGEDSKELMYIIRTCQYFMAGSKRQQSFILSINN